MFDPVLIAIVVFGCMFFVAVVGFLKSASTASRYDSTSNVSTSNVGKTQSDTAPRMSDIGTSPDTTTTRP